MTAGRCLGRKPTRRDARTLRLASYLRLAELPPPPPARDWSSKAAPNWGQMLNDQIGDCTCAAAGHLIQAWSANRGAEVTPSNVDIQVAYSAITGYTPSDPTTDTGAVELDVLNYWRATGIAGQRIGAYAAVSPQNQAHVEAAINLFGGAYLGLALPISAQDQTVWDVETGAEMIPDDSPGSWGGHAVCAVGYDAAHVLLVTWGAIKVATWPWFRLYCEEAYALIDPAWVDGTTPAPSGFDLAQLQADLAAIA